MDTELFEHWFHSFAQAAGITLHVETLYGTNNHHIVESASRASPARCAQAVEIDPRKADAIPSTKGTLGRCLSRVALIDYGAGNLHSVAQRAEGGGRAKASP